MNAAIPALCLVPKERRSEPRLQVNDKAELVLEDGSGVYAAEVIDISAHGCRVRLRPGRFGFHASRVRVRTAEMELSWRVMWINSTEKHVDIGLLLQTEPTDA